MEDAVRKGRMCKGEDRPGAKLTDTRVKLIRCAPKDVSNLELAIEFGISPSVICEVRHGKRWKHVTQAAL
jgi:hypothetical protein